MRTFIKSILNQRPFLKDPITPIVFTFWACVLLIFQLFNDSLIISKRVVLQILILFLFLNIWALIILFIKKRNEKNPNGKTE